MATTISLTRTPVTITFSGAQGVAGTGAVSWGDITGTANYIPFDTTPTAVPADLGVTFWNTDGECLEYNVDGGSISVGKETFDYYTNLSGVAMVDGDIVSIVSASGNRTAVDLTDVTDATSAANAIGMVTNGAANNGKVRVTKVGSVHSLNTSGLIEGGAVYVDPANPGKWTQTRPSSPNHVVSIGFVQVTHSVNGVVDVVPNHQCIVSADITDATSSASAGTVVLRSANGDASFRRVILQNANSQTQFQAHNTGAATSNVVTAPTGAGTLALTSQTNGSITASDISDPQNFIASAIEKTAPVDADQLAITDSEASGALKRLTFANLWTWVKSKLDGNLTIAGTKTWSGQQEATGQTATNGTSLMTRDLTDSRSGTKTVLDIDRAYTSDAAPKSLLLSDGTTKLGVSIAANEIGAFEVLLNLNDLNANSNYRFTVVGPSGCTGRWAIVVRRDASTTSGNWSTTIGSAVSYATVLAGNDHFAYIVGTFTNGSTAGTLEIQMAQGSSSANTMTVKKGSTFRKH